MSKSIPLSFLGSADFFRDYWQKRPLCLRGALAGSEAPISEDELAGLACEDIIESRLILEHGATPWELKSGPFSAAIFQKLPESHWTLLVQAVNHWVPAVQDLLQHFVFLPSYYLDDVMVSYAAKQGSVGPHFDYYDVFILQGSGKRHWQLGQFCSPHTKTLTTTPLGILENFVTQEEYILEPGDLLYIPQQQAHWCVAEQPGLSYSIGFRTPAYSELLNSFCSEIMSHLDESQRLKIIPKPYATPAEITIDMVENLQKIFAELLQNPQQLLEWVGRYLTEPKYPDLEHNVIHKKYTNLVRSLEKYSVMRHNESSNFAYHVADGEVYLFVDAKCYRYPETMATCIALLCNQAELACDTVLQIFAEKPQQELLLFLLRQGALYFS